VHVLMGQALDGLERTPEAITEFQAAARIAPREPNVHFGLGYLYWKSHQYDDAEREFKAELALDPKHGQSVAYLGDIEMKRNKPAGALVLLRKAVGLKNDVRIAYMDLGAIYTQQKQYAEAEAALRRAIELDPKQSDAHYRLGNVYKAMGNIVDAQKEFTRVRQLQENPDEDLVRKMSSPPSLNSPKPGPPN